MLDTAIRGQKHPEGISNGPSAPHLYKPRLSFFKSHSLDLIMAFLRLPYRDACDLRFEVGLDCLFGVPLYPLTFTFITRK